MAPVYSRNNTVGSDGRSGSVNSMATMRGGDEEGNQNFRIASLPVIGGSVLG